MRALLIGISQEKWVKIQVKIESKEYQENVSLKRETHKSNQKMKMCKTCALLIGIFRPFSQKSTTISQWSGENLAKSTQSIKELLAKKNGALMDFLSFYKDVTNFVKKGHFMSIKTFVKAQRSPKNCVERRLK